MSNEINGCEIFWADNIGDEVVRLKDYKKLEKELAEVKHNQGQVLLAFNYEREEREKLEKDLANLKKLYERRDGNASFQLMYDHGFNPFNTADMKIVDYGVSDNIYSLSCDLFQKTFNDNRELKEAMKRIAGQTDEQVGWNDAGVRCRAIACGALQIPEPKEGA